MKKEDIEILKFLGEGSYGIVYECLIKSTNEHIVAKELKSIDLTDFDTITKYYLLMLLIVIVILVVLKYLPNFMV